ASVKHSFMAFAVRISCSPQQIRSSRTCDNSLILLMLSFSLFLIFIYQGSYLCLFAASVMVTGAAYAIVLSSIVAPPFFCSDGLGMRKCRFPIFGQKNFRPVRGSDFSL